MSAASSAGMAGAESALAVRWKATCAYVGTQFSGWQSQADGNAVQDFIERRLAQIFGQPVRIHGSGRTDTGVHARAQVFHFDAAWRHGAAALLRALGVGLPAGLQVTALRQAPAGFHARFSATGKVYVYRLYLGRADPFDAPFCWSVRPPLDFAAMRAAAAVLRGRHDFRAFSASGGEEREDTVRDLRRLEVRGSGRRWRVVAEADGFLYRMVRSLVGALVAAGKGKVTPAELAQMVQDRQRPPAVVSAPAAGLFLWRVHYGRGERR
jgi:tRNA pseudouridine38-40 synthase